MKKKICILLKKIAFTFHFKILVKEKTQSNVHFVEKSLGKPINLDFVESKK